MQYSKYFAMAMLVCLGTLTLQQVAKADLTVAETVAQFNALNGRQGASFKFNSVYTQPIGGANVGEYRLTATGNDFATVGDFAPLAAYTGTTSGSNYFSTFCIEQNQTIDTNVQYFGKLNYDSTTGKTQNTSKPANVLALGGAYLYQKFAMGELTVSGFAYDYTTNYNSRAATAVDLQNALHFLTDSKQGTTDWDSGNMFLKYLLSVKDDKAFWKNDYNLNDTYRDLGDFNNYAVFVLNVGGNQDQLYVAKVSRPGTDTPEPATMLLWLTGGLSALGFGYAKKRRKATSLA